jgi:hypothetical protein
MSVLSNIDITDFSKYFKLPLIGVFSKDELPVVHKDGLYVVNMSNHDVEGTHWVGFGIEKGRCWFFDSYGVACPLEIEKFLQKYKPIIYSTKQIQKLNGSFCGWAVLLASYFMYHSKIKDIESRYKEFLNLFDFDDQIKNEKIIHSLFNKIKSSHRMYKDIPIKI